MKLLDRSSDEVIKRTLLVIQALMCGYKLKYTDKNLEPEYLALDLNLKLQVHKRVTVEGHDISGWYPTLGLDGLFFYANVANSLSDEDIETIKKFIGEVQVIEMPSLKTEITPFDYIFSRKNDEDTPGAEEGTANE